MLSHYIIVRGDLSPGEQLAYVVHAATGSVCDAVPSDTRAVVLAVPDAKSLEKLSHKMGDADLDYELIWEDKVPFSMGLAPLDDPVKLKDLRRITSSLPLAG